MMQKEFNAEVRNRKSLVASARRRVCGSKSKYCGLPSDYMTQAEWKKKNGEVVVMNLNVPQTWGQFKSMPVDLQQEYIDKCIKQFECSMVDFAHIFGVSAVTVRSYFKTLGISDQFVRGKRRKADVEQRFQQWLNPNEHYETEKPVPMPRQETNDPQSPATESWADLALAETGHVELIWDRQFNLAHVFTLVGKCISDTPCRLRIVIDKEGFYESV